jgi:hypothetical protein
MLTRGGPLAETRSRGHPEPFQELNLDVSTEELLSAERAFTYADLHAMLGKKDTIAWLSPHAAVVREHDTAPVKKSILENEIIVSFNVNGKKLSAVALSSATLSESFDVVRRLLLADTSEVYELRVWKIGIDRELYFYTPNLANMMEQCQNLKVLSLMGLEMDENHIRVLGAFSRPDLEIEMIRCRIAGAAATVLAEVLEGNQGPTKLVQCDMDISVLANGLRGNSRLKSLIPRYSRNDEDGNAEVLATAGAFKENKGLVELTFIHFFSLKDENWDAVCDSLKTHPTLEILNLQEIHPLGALALTPSVLSSRIHTLVDMLKVNESIHTVHANPRCTACELFQGSVIPRLETNRLRPRVRAIQITRPSAYRAKVLGRALLAVRTDPNRFWMLLSGNPEVLFPSTTTSTALVANLPTPASTTASSNTAAIAAPGDPGATDNIAKAAAGQKRKA